MKQHFLYRPLVLLAAAWPSLATAEDWPAPLQALEKQGLTIHERFEAPAGLTGYAASVQGRELAAYVTQDEKYALVGTLVDAQGNDLTSDRLYELVKKPQDAELWESLADSAWIADGDDDAERVIYTFTDPNCPYCKKFWDQTRPWVEAGKVQMRHIMVGILKQDSPIKALSLLAADDPAEALADHQRGNEISTFKEYPRDYEDALAENHQLMQSLGLGATPSTLYRHDGKLSVMQGVPPADKLETIMGSPAP